MSAKSRKVHAQHLLYFERTFRKWGYSKCACFERSKNNVNFTKTRLRAHA